MKMKMEMDPVRGNKTMISHIVTIFSEKSNIVQAVNLRSPEATYL